MRLVIAGVLLLLALGCSPKRTELGYGFYYVGTDLIRRVPTPDGKIVDENWWPSKYSGGKPVMFLGDSQGTRRLKLVLAEKYLDFDLRFASREELDTHLGNLIDIIEIDIAVPEYRELGTYSEVMSTLDPDDPVREKLEIQFHFVSSWMALGHGFKVE